ncbi:hypothetical protein CFter6_1022 [Collimonas fungivorans]|uniref:Uncharacterized protein n=1 Tax=Collimonas fungivorans TaxID=158899 RepID=A0A127P7E8_9BURK|nr:hypothetical protein CFter6_1022 [Collimonas fungivorans]
MVTIEVNEDRGGKPVVSILQVRSVLKRAMKFWQQILATTSGNNARQ